MRVEHAEWAWWKSVIVLTVGSSIDSLIADFQLSFRTKITPTAEKVSRTFQKER